MVAAQVRRAAPRPSAAGGVRRAPRRRQRAHARRCAARANERDAQVAEGGAAEAEGGVGAYKELALWVGATALFGAGVAATQGADPAAEFFAGYVLEESLSVDNLFVFILVFQYFKTPPVAQEAALRYGIAGAAVLRATFVLAGAAALERFEGVLAVFAVILLYSSWKLLTQEEEEEESLEDNALVKVCRQYITTSSDYDGDKFFTLQDGVKVATPLLLATAVIELSDIVFAVDSIPAVFGVTRDPFIVYTSNLFAILSLRSLYGFVQGALEELRFLQPAVALVLGFIGAKMLADLGGYHVPTLTSLEVVAGLIGGGVGASLLLPEPEEEEA